MIKKFMLSAVALIGFTVASYGANTVEKVEVNENLLVEATSDPCSDCYHNFNNALNALTAMGDSLDDAIDTLEPVFNRCVAKHCDN